MYIDNVINYISLKIGFFPLFHMSTIVLMFRESRNWLTFQGDFAIWMTNAWLVRSKYCWKQLNTCEKDPPSWIIVWNWPTTSEMPICSLRHLLMFHNHTVISLFIVRSLCYTVRKLGHFCVNLRTQVRCLSKLFFLECTVYIEMISIPFLSEEKF